MENNQENTTAKKITVGLVLSWGFGLLLLISGLASLSSDPIRGLLTLFLAIWILPPSSREIERRLHIHLSGGVKFIMVLAIFLFIGKLGSNSLQQGNRSPETNGSFQPLLEVQNFQVYTEYSYVHLTGEVKNISSKPLDGVMAVGSFYTKDGTFVKSADALIDYNPILPGQISPFEVLTTDNPAIENGKVTFKYLLKGQIPTREKK